MKNQQEAILDFLGKETTKEDFHLLIKYFNDLKISENKEQIRLLISLLSRISKNHYRLPNFIRKIEQIILNFKNEIQKNLTNIELFKIFKNNKKILLFLFKEKIIIPDKDISIFLQKKFYEYFYPEFSEFYELKKEQFFDDIDTFNQKRNIGENDNYISRMIREDNLNDFISFVNKNDVILNSQIESSIFETNSFLIKNNPTIIEYAAFYGSIQIFKYLVVNNCQLNPSLWLYAIHGMDSEIIHILEEKKIKPSNNSFLNCFIESLKCHNINISNYLIDNYISNDEKKSNEIKIISTCLKNHNFICLNYIFENKFDDILFVNRVGLLCMSCEFDFFELFKFLMAQDKIDINHQENRIEEKRDQIIIKTQSVIYYAIEKNNNEMIELILSHPNISINQKNKIEKSIIKQDIIDENLWNEYLLKEKLTIENTVLNMELKRKNYEIVKLLLSRPEIDVNLVSTIKNNNEILDEKTALFLAVENGNKEIIELLLSRNVIDINQVLKYSSIIDQSIQKFYFFNTNYSNNDEFSHKKLNIILKTVLHIAIEQNNIDIIQFLLSQPNIDPNLMTDSKDKQTPLYLAVEQKNPQIIQLLIKHPNIDINQKSIISIKYLQVIHFLNLVKSIVEEKTPLHRAIELQNIEIIKLLLSIENTDVNAKYCRKDKNNEYKTSLHIAIEIGNVEIIQLLLSRPDIYVNIKSLYIKKGNMGHKSKSKKTPLFEAIEKGNLDILKLLLSVDYIKVNKKSIFTRKGYSSFRVVKFDGDEDEVPAENEDYIEEKTLLQAAVENENLEVIKYLLSNAEIDVNELLISKNTKEDLFDKKVTTIKTSTTVLNLAIEKNNIDIVKFLLSIDGIDVNCRSIITENDVNIKSKTALHISVENKNVEIIKLLLNHDQINVNDVDENGKNLFQLTDDEIIKNLFK